MSGSWAVSALSVAGDAGGFVHIYSEKTRWHDKNTKEMNKKGTCGMIEAVIFDLDGSMVDSMWIWRSIDIE